MSAKELANAIKDHLDTMRNNNVDELIKEISKLSKRYPIFHYNFTRLCHCWFKELAQRGGFVFIELDYQKK